LKVLITGGAGFIGSNLIERLLSLNYDIVCLDNLSTGFYNNIEPYVGNNKFTFIKGDIRNIEVCRNATEGVDYILHEAALGSVPRSINDPITSNDVNISGFLNMLVAARDAQVKRFVYAASSSTYGDSKDLPKKENIIGKPLSPYAITKYVNELYADVFSKTYGIECIGLRYFNVFGKRQNPNGEYAAVIPIFINKFINNEDIFINGDGTVSRDFTFIENVLEMNLLAITSKNKESVNTVYNTAVGERTSLNELVTYIHQILKDDFNINSSSKINYRESRRGDIQHSLADISKANALLGYAPKFRIKEGLKKTIEWYINNK
jgi:Nucleoside-diphosphate-sugar epimerases